MKKSQSAESEEKRRLWKHHLEQWKASGLSQVEYCSKHELNIKSFRYHKRRSGKSALCLVEVPLAAPIYPVPNPISLAVGPRYTIRIEAGFDADTLRRLLEVLDR